MKLTVFHLEVRDKHVICGFDKEEALCVVVADEFIHRPRAIKGVFRINSASQQKKICHIRRSRQQAKSLVNKIVHLKLGLGACLRCNGLERIEARHPSIFPYTQHMTISH